MSQGTWPYAPPPKPPVSAADLVISIITLIFAVLMGLGGAVMGLFMLAFLDHCPPESCSVDGAVSAVMTAVLIAAVAVLVGLVITIVRLIQRKTAWPFAVGTVVACIVVLFFGAVGYGSAVG